MVRITRSAVCLQEHGLSSWGGRWCVVKQLVGGGNVQLHASPSAGAHHGEPAMRELPSTAQAPSQCLLLPAPSHHASAGQSAARAAQLALHSQLAQARPHIFRKGGELIVGVEQRGAGQDGQSWAAASGSIGGRRLNLRHRIQHQARTPVCRSAGGRAIKGGRAMERAVQVAAKFVRQRSMQPISALQRR